MERVAGPQQHLPPQVRFAALLPPSPSPALPPCSPAGVHVIANKQSQVAETAALLYPSPPPSPAGVHVVAHIHFQVAKIAALLPPQIEDCITEGEHLSVGKERGKRGQEGGSIK